MSQEDYSKAFKKECDRYFAAMKEISAKPWPKLTGLSKEERRKVLAGKVREDTKVMEALATDFRKIKPPTSYAGVHSAYQELLDGQIRINNAYASAIEANDSAEATKQNQEYVKFLSDQMDVVLDQLEKSGGDIVKLRDELVQSMKVGR